MPSVEQRLAKLEVKQVKIVGVVKDLRSQVQDLWDRVNADDEAHGLQEDETRAIAERARRLAQRLEKTVKEIE